MRFPLLAAGWAALCCHAQVVINELHPAPDLKQERVEFIELHNAGSAAVDLSGWHFNSGIEFEFPQGTQIPAGSYLVVAQDPAALRQKFGFAQALGPWTGRLSGAGETVVLRDAAGTEVDSVDYGQGFPWPTVGDEPGYSLELIHPALDNRLGGSWRASFIGEVNPGSLPLIAAGTVWNYRKGTAEASSPTTAWRAPEFDDTDWESGPLPIGYDPAVGFGTRLDDMINGYRQLFLRRNFNVTDAANITALRLEALFDDGFKLWINGQPLLDAGLPAGEVAFNDNATGGAREDNGYTVYNLSLPAGLLRNGDNVIAVQLANVNLGSSSDCFFDCRLFALTGPSGRGPTPGRINAVFATVAPPAIWQVSHSPKQPRAGDATVISARITDPEGVAEATLEYQVVAPGSYLELGDDAYRSDWTPVPMLRTTADTNVFAAMLPAAVIRHRNLVRYRIAARDARGTAVRVPYADDPQPNFALFVYDGVPAWTGSIRPGVAPTFSVPTNEMNRLPVYHLLAKKQSVEDCTWRDRSHGDEYFWHGTLVYDGEVYDHIRMRPRGGVWRYAMGKNMWKFDFNRGHDFQARDNWGRKLRTAWTKLNLGSCIQQGDYGFRGEQGLFESVGFRLFQLAGQPAMHSAFVQFRIIDEAEEAKAGDQFSGDFWGLYLALEQPDGRFLEEHGLPDGNLYKMEGGGGDANNLGPDGPVDESDLRAFQNAYQNQLANLDESWWRTNFNLPTYYNYQAIVQAIHHYDIADGKNYFFYRQPDNGQWMTIVWDLDLTWADSMYRSGQQGGDEPFKSRVLSNFSTTSPRYPNISREFRNRVREIRDLMWNTDEAWRLVDEYVRLVRGTNASSLIEADRAQWDYHPVMASSLVNSSKAGQGRYYQFPLASGVSKSFAGASEWMKRYIGYRATNTTFSLDTMSAEPGKPIRPTLTYSGPAGFPVNRLQFSASRFAGNAPFRSVKFRVAEVTRPEHPAFRPDEPLPYEITPTWESDELTVETGSIVLPQEALRVGRLYRARMRFTDAQGRSSNWSPPVEFTAGEPDNGAGLVAHLKLTELMYNPAPAGFEFLEVRNASTNATLRLDGANFTAGIDYTFPTNSTLPPGAYAVLIGTTNRAGFLSYHRLPDTAPVFGPFEGNLANGGETITLKTSAGGEVIFSVTYDDTAPWPTAADGTGPSLVPLTEGTGDLNAASSWRTSWFAGGSPGQADSEAVPFGFGPVESSENSLRISFSAAPSQVWLLESTDELGAWTPTATNTGPATLILPLDSATGRRFYRAVAR